MTYSRVGEFSPYPLLLSSTATLHPAYGKTTSLFYWENGLSYSCNLAGVCLSQIKVQHMGNLHNHVFPHQPDFIRNLNYKKRVALRLKAISSAPFSKANSLGLYMYAWPRFREFL